jgi:hypothetical protein
VSEDSVADRLACVEGTSSNGWVDGEFDRNTGAFSVELDATPGSSDEDALVGLGHDIPNGYADLGAIVRFNPDGKLDARDGGAYRAVDDISYLPGQPHHLVFDVDMASHTYSARDTSADFGLYIARDFAFRSEQASAPDLAFYGVKVDSGGPLDVCNVLVESGACTTATAGGGFVNGPFAPQETFVTVAFDATPSDSGVDVVMGVSSSPASSFSDIAAAVRFNPDGRIDARDGDGYREVPGLDPYVAGESYHFVLMLDVLAHQYAVSVNGSAILGRLAFRTQQAHASSIGNLVIESDGEAGAGTRCAVTVTPARDAAYVHDTGIAGPLWVALPDGRYLSTSEGETVVYDTAGFPAGTAPLAWPLAVDAAGNSYQTGGFWGTYDTGAGTLTSAGGSDIFLLKYDAAFHLVRATRYGGPDDDMVTPPIVNARGDVLLVLDTNLTVLDAQGNVVYGSERWNGLYGALAPDGSVFSSDDPPTYGAFSFTRRDPSGNVAWTRVLPILEGRASLQAIAADGTGGLVFAGQMDGTLDLGGGHRFALVGGDAGVKTFIAKLDADGQYVYATGTNIDTFYGLTVDACGNAAVSGQHVNPDVARLDEYRADGSLLRQVSADSLLPTGMPTYARGAVVADWSGDLYWSFNVGAQDGEGFFVKLRAP